MKVNSENEWYNKNLLKITWWDNFNKELYHKILQIKSK